MFIDGGVEKNDRTVFRCHVEETQQCRALPEHQNLIVVSAETVLKAAKLVESCETCNPIDAAIPFDWILDQVTGLDSTVTDYVIEEAAKCPNCRWPIFEKTPVKPTQECLMSGAG
jgi:hypothetical protein